MGFWDKVVSFFKRAWEAIKAFGRWLKGVIIRLTELLKDFLEKCLNKLKGNKNLVAVTIKENLGNGNFNTVTCIFNKETEEIIEDKNSVAHENSTMDSDLEKNFGDKDMIVYEVEG